MTPSEFYINLKSKVKAEINEFLKAQNLKGLKEVTDIYSFVEASNLTLAIYPSVENGTTVRQLENGWECYTTINLFVNDSFDAKSLELTEKYYDALLEYFSVNLFSMYDIIDNSSLVIINSNGDYNGCFILLKSRIDTTMDYSQW